MSGKIQHKIIDGVEVKWCNKHKEYLPATDEYFYRKASGFRSWCKTCVSFKNRRAYVANKTAVKQQKREEYHADIEASRAAIRKRYRTRKIKHLAQLLTPASKKRP